MKKAHWFALIIFVPLFSNFQCDQEFPCTDGENIARFTAQVSPEQKIYDLGDTIWISADFSTEIELTNRPETILLDSTNLGVGLFAMHLNGTRDLDRGLSDFNIVDEADVFSRTSAGTHHEFHGTIELTCSAYRCAFQIGFIPKTTGYYAFALDGGWFQFEEHLECPPLNKFRDNLLDVMNRNTKLYEEIDQNTRFPVRLGTGRQVLLGNHDNVFTFKVQKL